MNAVIVEIKNGFAAALCDDGCIIKIKNNNYGIGQVIDMNKQTTKNTMMKKIIALTSTVAVTALISGTSALAYFTPYSYVSVDVNPSIEYSLNRFDRVLSAKAVNNDGSEILAGLDLKNKKIEDAIKETVEEIAEKGYFDKETSNAIMIATYNPNDKTAEKLAEALKEDVKDAVATGTKATQTTATQTTATQTTAAQTTNATKDIEIEAVSVGKQRVLEAKELGVTPGKLNLVQKLQASSKDPNSVDINEWLKKPVKEIMKATQENKKSEKTLAKETTKETQPSTVQTTTTTSSTTSTEQKQSESTKTELQTIKPIEKFEIESIKPVDKKELESQKSTEKAERESSKATAEAKRESSKTDAEAIRESIKAQAEDERESNKADAEAIRESIKAQAEHGNNKNDGNEKSNGKNK